MCHLRGRMQVEVMHYLAAELHLHFDDFWLSHFYSLSIEGDNLLLVCALWILLALVAPSDNTWYVCKS